MPQLGCRLATRRRRSGAEPGTVSPAAWLLRPATFLLLVLSVIHSFQVFDLTYGMTGGGPGFSTTMLVQYIFQSAIVLVFTVVQWRVGPQSENVL